MISERSLTLHGPSAFARRGSGNSGSDPTRPRICFSRFFPASQSISAALNNRDVPTCQSPTRSHTHTQRFRPGPRNLLLLPLPPSGLPCPNGRRHPKAPAHQGLLPSFVPVVHGVPRLRESVEINRQQFGYSGRSGGCPERRIF